MPQTHDQPGVVFIVDDDPGIRKSLCLKLVTCGFQAEPRESIEMFLADFDEERADCVVLDLRLRGMSGLDALEQLVSRGVRTPVIVVTGHGDVQSAVRAMKLGAFDFLEKPWNPVEIIERVRQAVSWNRGRVVRTKELETIRANLVKLSPTERRVLTYLKKGLTTAEIASELYRSVRTIENHRMHILNKMNAKNVAELVRFALLDELTQARPDRLTRSADESAT